MFVVYFLYVSFSRFNDLDLGSESWFSAIVYQLFCCFCSKELDARILWHSLGIPYNYFLEKYQEPNVDLYMTFVDFNKAFDTVSLDEHWKIMAKFGCQPRFIVMVRQVMMTCRHVFGMMESTLNLAVLWHQHCSAWCFLPCLQILLQNVFFF